MVICLILALLVGLALSGRAIAQGQPVSELQTQISQPTPPKSSKKKSGIDGTWKLQLTQKQFVDPFTQKQITEFRLFADLRYEPLQNVYFLLGPKFTYANGFVQTQDDQGATKAEWSIREISINGDLTYLQASAGALDQTPQHPSVLLFEQTFPAAKLRLHSNSHANWVYSLQGETGIPTSSSLSPQTQTFEKTPGYQSGFVGVMSQKMRIDLDAKVGAFQFQNLPTSVATKSALLGNTTTNTNGGDSQFIYEYSGGFVQLQAKARLMPRLDLGVNLEAAQNNQVSQNLSHATLARAFSDFRFIRNFEISPFYESFRIEPDAVVALYNSDMLNTNRVGYRGGLAVTYKQTLKVSVSSGERDVIYESPFQQREKTLYLRLETLDVAI
jgi:hypothetical protein